MSLTTILTHSAKLVVDLAVNQSQSLETNTVYSIRGIDKWMFPKIGVPQNGWFTVYIMENPIKMDDLGVPLFVETPIGIYGSLSLKIWRQIYKFALKVPSHKTGRIPSVDWLCLTNESW